MAAVSGSCVFQSSLGCLVAARWVENISRINRLLYCVSPTDGSILFFFFVRAGFGEVFLTRHSDATAPASRHQLQMLLLQYLMLAVSVLSACVFGRFSSNRLQTDAAVVCAPPSPWFLSLYVWVCVQRVDVQHGEDVSRQITHTGHVYDIWIILWWTTVHYTFMLSSSVLRIIMQCALETRHCNANIAWYTGW